MHLCHLWMTEALAIEPDQVHDMHPRAMFPFHQALIIL